MKAVLTWAFSAALLWFLLLLGVTVAATQYPDLRQIEALQTALLSWGPVLGEFAGPPLTLAIVIYIIFNALEKFGLQGSLSRFQNWTVGGNVQAIIAIVIITAFAVAALGGVGRVSDLKDIALVVVGFYFGKKAKDESDAVAQSAMIGAVAGSQLASENGSEDRDLK